MFKEGTYYLQLSRQLHQQLKEIRSIMSQYLHLPFKGYEAGPFRFSIVIGRPVAPMLFQLETIIYSQLYVEKTKKEAGNGPSLKKLLL